jgi:predicted O-linked N-acetylglucosamine transferase (SPINDLY family)
LTAVGFPELITKTTGEYEALATSLGSNPDQLRAIKSKLHVNKTTAPLFNTPKFAENLEKLYEIAHQRAISGQQPESIRVS